MFSTIKWTAPKTSRAKFPRKAGLNITIAVVILPLLAACGRAETPPPRNETSAPDQVESLPEQEGSPPESSAPEAINGLAGSNPCGLLTGDEYGAFFGEPAAPGAEPKTIGFYRSCMVWNQSGTKFITLQLAHYTPEEFKAELEASAAMLDLELVPVAGLGDEAVSYSGLLHVRIGETVLQVLTWIQDPDQALEVSRQIAQLALPRLP